MRPRILQFGFRGLARRDLGNDAERDQSRNPLDVLGRTHGVVEVFEEKRQRQCGGQSEQHVHDQRAGQVRRRRRARQRRLVDDEDVVGADAAGDVHFLVALQQAVIERPVGVDFALENIVLDAALLQIEHVRFERLDPPLHLVFLVQRRLVGRLVGGFQRFQLGRELPVDLGDLIAELHHLRIARLERLQLVLIFGRQRIALGAQRLDHRIGQELRQIDRGCLIQLLPQLLILDSFGNQHSKRGIGVGQIGFRNRRLVVRRDDLLLLAEIEQRLFRILRAAISGS